MELLRNSKVPNSNSASRKMYNSTQRSSYLISLKNGGHFEFSMKVFKYPKDIYQVLYMVNKSEISYYIHHS